MTNVWTRKFPTLIGILLLTIGTVLTTFLVQGGTIFQIKAGPGQDPKNIKISNVYENSFTVSYITDDQVIGTVNYGIDPSNLDGIALDDRDQLSQKINKYNTHSVTIRGLDANSKYYYSINSGDKNYLDKGAPFETSTKGEISDNPSSQIPVSGKTTLPDGSIPKDGIVYLKTNEGELISALLKEDGAYSLPLNTLRRLDIDKYLEIGDSTLINIDIYAAGLFSTVSVNRNEISPVPLITLSGNYDFSSSSENSNNEKAASPEGFPSFGNNSTDPKDPKILIPNSNEKLSEAQPTFEGSAQPNEIVEITIHSDENIKAQVKADKNGNWEYIPTKELSPGEHTITIITKNKNGILKTITRNFIVFADGENISQTLTPTKKITNSPTPNMSPTPFPSGITISPTPTIPPTGNSSVIITGIVGFAVAASGIIVFFLTRGRNSL